MGFAAGALASLTRSIALLVVTMRVQIPNSSLFPEIDFAARCVESTSGTFRLASTLGQLLYPLSNATSKEVRKRLKNKRIFVGVSSANATGDDHIELTETRPTVKFRRAQVYS